MSEIVITKLEQTCTASPSQWEGETSDGRFVYIRYRWGRFQATCAPTLDRAVSCLRSDVDAMVLADEQIAGGWDGYMSTDEMKERLNGIIGARFDV